MLRGENIGKKYNRTWVFRNLDFELKKGDSVAITGKNGAGKSTLLQIVAGYLTPSEGKITSDGKELDELGLPIAYIGPYTEIIEEFTLREFLSFHQKFKTPIMSAEEMAVTASLPLDKPIFEFSTGMKQRTKLITAFFFENDIVFMDEPTSNLDEEGVHWWENSLIYCKDRLLVVASNDSNEIGKCAKQLNL